MLNSTLLQPIRNWLDRIEIDNPKLAHLLCQVIPVQCPFERKLSLWGRWLVHLPPLCKLNPLYEQIVSLRFRALCYLADECGEDVRCYC
ncbi:Mo-dependent nitrogenase C-terminal domain-containing protein [Chroococcus sp. FPU101]|uniref:Mo-dependent nitrogenase C-terminal domain-containing protein n=1 Tax=Chroococcus sp. FPU101 TaxID=1974212 RepID=UPI001AA502E3|nr:Mo-dependent nitrogenase C-terminal domain-containing protein [Chroococcus sp. FPU101]GFE71994.1 hypothetical protein CFPU101_46040 [Chroococcus sp. FPU101]